MTPHFDRVFDALDEGAEPLDDVLAAYGPLPAFEPGGLPALAVNFASSLDGKVSFGGDRPGAQLITGGVLHDRWLMALLRARADAVVVGAGTLWADRDHEWSSRFICPEDAELFDRLRGAEGRSGLPLCVIVTHDGALPHDAEVLTTGAQPALVATTVQGAERIARDWRESQPATLVLGDGRIDPRSLLARLGERGYERILCEGGPRLYAAILEAGVPHDLYLTICPLVVGGDEGTAISLGRGADFTPEDAPRASLRSVRTDNDQLYLRYRVAGQ